MRSNRYNFPFLIKKLFIIAIIGIYLTSLLNINVKADWILHQSNFENALAQGSILDGITTSKAEYQSTGHSQDGYNKTLKTQNEINTTKKWKATQYMQGDIISNSYTVQLGDTLWQIAKGYYGSGSEWTKILKSNSSIIGYLNKQHCLIISGQKLILP